MDKELARHVITVGFHSLSLMEGLIPLLKTHCDNAEFQTYLKAIGAVSAEMSLEIFNKIFEEHPDLQNEVAQTIDKYGKFI